MVEPWFPPCQVRREGDSAESEFVLPAGSPWFEGHFPEVPMLPGVGMLALAVHLMSSALKRPVRVEQIKKLRFRGIVRPGERVAYKASWTERAGRLETRIEIHREGENIGGGSLLLGLD